MPSYGKVALAVVVGNEDGAHHTAAELFQALTEVGFTIPAGGVTYWVGEAMGEKEYKDFGKAPKAIAEWTPMLASNAAHLARLLKERSYPESRVAARLTNLDRHQPVVMPLSPSILRPSRPQVSCLRPSRRS